MSPEEQAARGDAQRAHAYRAVENESDPQSGRILRCACGAFTGPSSAQASWDLMGRHVEAEASKAAHDA